MDDQACPRCKTTKYRNPSLKLMVNICGHTLCESCVDLLFLKGSGSCPECNIVLRRTNYRVQLFEDPMVEKEIDIRKRVLRDFNKKEEDFASLRDYNDYLEEIETIIFNLSNNIDIIETNKKIENYKRENREQILKNKSKINQKEIELDELIQIEKQQEEEKMIELAQQDLETEKNKIREREALIQELIYSEGNADSIVKTFASAIQASKEENKKVVTMQKVTQFSSGIKFGNQGGHNFMPLPKIDDGPLFNYEPIIQDIDGPSPPDCRQLQVRGYINHIRLENPSERAGGFKANIACLRALQEAMVGLYHNPLIKQNESMFF
ncbi:CDK-activating kinase assembly factor MAT1 [Leptopilina boulardi]|uniref:CDK-activating kinase assembly factor MAT1 n=1 Tax=Leptopilina boulardi TaxID=63433 RepID=UPI0021F523C0|nr:CDK-activating kinase assembly factor MAT1 [Leptopilina boulardi]